MYIDVGGGETFHKSFFRGNKQFLKEMKKIEEGNHVAPTLNDRFANFESKL